MLIFVSYVYFILKIIDKLLNKIFNKKNFINFVFDELYKKNITKIKINNKIIKFWTPGVYAKYFTDNFLKKRQTIENFILQFPDKKDVIFWDIGSNLGLYSIFCAANKKKVKIVSFECSPSAVLAISKNITLNNYEKRITICQIGLTNSKSSFLMLNEHKDSLGSQYNALGNNFLLKNKKLNVIKNKFKVYSSTIKNILQNQSVEVPNYIKLDVDGFELEILEAFGNFLQNKKIKSIVTEIKFGSRKIDNMVVDDKKIDARSNKIYNILFRAGFKSRHLEQRGKKEGWYLDIFYR